MLKIAGQAHFVKMELCLKKSLFVSPFRSRHAPAPSAVRPSPGAAAAAATLARSSSRAGEANGAASPQAPRKVSGISLGAGESEWAIL